MFDFEHASFMSRPNPINAQVSCIFEPPTTNNNNNTITMKDTLHANKNLKIGLEALHHLGKGHEEKLQSAGIHTVEDVLVKCGGAHQRQHVEKQTGLSDAILVALVECADLMRIKHVTGDQGILLLASGVKSVQDLATKQGESLHAHMVDVNNKQSIVTHVPSVEEVSHWIFESQELPVVFHK